MNADAKASRNGSVLDLPQLYTRPPAAELLSTLNRLQVRPSTWDNTEAAVGNVIDEEGLPKYLTGIIASPLAWIVDDNVKEQIWEAASSRLSERVAIPSVSRTFAIPATTCTEAVSVTLHEPSLTADNLGHKTWLASFLLARRLPSILPYISSLHQGESQKSRSRVIELGAGTGLVGLAVAALFDVDVHLTDLPTIVPNLRANVDTHLLSAPNKPKGVISVGELDWSDLPCPQDEEHTTYDIVVAADPLYSPQHPAWLVAAIRHVLKQAATARAVVELPLREAYTPEVEDFKQRMSALGLVIEAEGMGTGFEDWESAHIAVMVFGLLTLAAIPTTIGVAEGISSTKKKDEEEEEEDPTVASTTEAERMRKFRLQCYCDAPSSKAKEINGGTVVLRDDKLWIEPPNVKPSSPSSPFLGFYVPYPDPARHPPPLGLVSFVPTTPPMLNWIYVSLPWRELRYGNRTASIAHTVGPWAWDTGDDGVATSHAGDNGGGLTLEGKEGCVAFETGEGWQLFWEDAEGKIPGPKAGGGEKRRRRTKLQVSIERVFAEDAQDAGAGVMSSENKEKEKGKGRAEDDAGAEDKKVGKAEGAVKVHGEKGTKREERKTESTVEVRTRTVEEGKESGEKEERTRYEYRG
ncbi:MAG: hypothetical protein LQ338_007635 [Usnochroma carphineum]|nr:MAG: hypothetical protein LQ338_007635 [Usnochroma carphineum]